MAWNTMLLSIGCGLGLLGGVVAQGKTAAFTDSKTGIQFQQFKSADYTFGIALPEQPTGDFIGQISAKGAKGWAGVSLGGRMAKSLMVVAWPHENKVISSLRYSTGYANPGPSSNDSITLQRIASGTSAEGGVYTYTFLCKGCIQIDGSTFKASDAKFSLGFGHSPVAVTAPADSGSALNFHPEFGLFEADLTAAKSAKFSTWAGTAKAETQTDAPSTPPPAAGPATVSGTAYDHIVVGSGPAGLIAAQRLTETGRSVLLLERGGESIAATGGKRFVPWSKNLTYYDVPGVFMTMPFATLGEGFCSDTAGLAGCILGGGGTMNGMAFIRPPTWDFDDKWPAGWKSKDIAPSAARLYERNPGTTAPSKDGKYYDMEMWDVMEGWLKPNGWTQTDSIKNPDDKNKTYSYPSLNIANGIRSGPLLTYLPLAQAKSNFKLQSKTKVLRVVRDGPKMTGVEVEIAGTGLFAQARREIINLKPGGSVVLAAGVLSTPRLLWHSGIGRPAELNIVKNGRAKITLPEESKWINLPVGENVKDHSRFMLMFNVDGQMKTYTNSQLNNAPESEKALYAKGSGVLTQSFMRMDIFRRITNSKGQNFMFESHVAAPQNNKLEFTLQLTHGLTSVGTMSINANSGTIFKKLPWLNTPEDREAWTILLNELFDYTRKPGSRLTYSTGKNAKAEDVLRTPVQQGVHFVGGAKMGTDDGRTGGTAVVDLNTKVYGTDNLYVVDGSFHVDASTGNTQAIIMVAAEHAVQKIIAQYKA